MFQKARLQLTAWYLVIIMTISIFFSLLIYQRVNAEYIQVERMQAIMQEDPMHRFVPFQRRLLVERIDPDLISHARMRLITTLAFVNLIILGLAGASGYFLAGRTLRPIRRMLSDQRRFIADASHELRTPLTSLRSEIEVTLRNKSLTVPDSKKVLESNLEEVINLQLLSDNLLTLMQQENVTKKVTEKIILSEVITQATKKLEGLRKQKQITIRTEVTDIAIVGIHDRICELFVTLLDNAIKYSPTKSTVMITAKKKNKVARITIADEGIGIHKDDLPYVFDRFYRASKSRSKGSVSGYGLGLSIAKKIVSLHNGEISAASTLGKETTFTIMLPLTQGS